MAQEFCGGEKSCANHLTGDDPMTMPPLFLKHPQAAAFVGGFLAVAMLLLLIAPSPPPDHASARRFRPNITSYDIPTTLSFCGEPVPMDNPEVRKRFEREFYLNLQWDGQVMLYLKRSGEYFPMFEKMLAEAGAPDDLKYLAVAESALQMPQSSKDAVGLWQFIAETGRSYGLQIDDYVDERRHAEKSTAAAIRYLKDGYARFNSWTLSAAAYNMGEAATSDDLEFQRRGSYYDLYVNEETSRYLFRIVAIKEIMSNPAKYGFYLDSTDFYTPQTRTEVAVATDIPNLAAWADQQGSSYKDVKLLNPWIKKRTLLKPAAGRPYVIQLPLPATAK
ncbi:MAG: lytic transglycosylase domain-containing protein [Chlorobi bacterium CHB2]|nr:lytic transglycosylase domain-containing protein [Chlorobi bacterium CHB2]